MPKPPGKLYITGTLASFRGFQAGMLLCCRPRKDAMLTGSCASTFFLTNECPCALLHSIIANPVDYKLLAGMPSFDGSLLFFVYVKMTSLMYCRYLLAVLGAPLSSSSALAEVKRLMNVIFCLWHSDGRIIFGLFHICFLH